MHAWVFVWFISAGFLLGTALTTYRLLTSVSLALAAIDAPDL